MRHEGGPETGHKLSKTGPKLSKSDPNSVKRVLNSVEYLIFKTKTQSNGRVNYLILYEPAWDPKTGCVLAPLGPPTRSRKRSYVTAPLVPSTSAVLSTVRCWWVYRVGTGRAIPVPGSTTQPPARGGHQTSEAGPGSPQGWSGWVWGPGVLGMGTAAGTAPETTLRARSVPLGPPCLRTLRMPPLSQ